MDDVRMEISRIRGFMNELDAESLNERVSEDFFAVFCLGSDGYETYHCEDYRSGNIDAFDYYLGKQPYWKFRDMAFGQRSETEYVVTSHIDFSVNGMLTMKALCTEVYRCERGVWRLLRQYMEKYRPEGGQAF